MKLIPIFSEKSTALAQKGYYSFWVNPGLSKPQIKLLVAKSFGVHPISVATISKKGQVKRNMYGKTISLKARKKAIVKIKKDEKIDIFQTDQKKGKKK